MKDEPDTPAERQPCAPDTDVRRGMTVPQQTSEQGPAGAAGPGRTDDSAPSSLLVDGQDSRYDVGALGAILYNILALRPPVEGKSLNQVLLKVARGDITPPTGLIRTSAPRPPAAGRGRAEPPGGQRPEVAAAFPHCPAAQVPALLPAGAGEE